MVVAVLAEAWVEAMDLVGIGDADAGVETR